MKEAKYLILALSEIEKNADGFILENMMFQ